MLNIIRDNGPVLLIVIYVSCIFTPLIETYYLQVPLAIGVLFWVSTFRSFFKFEEGVVYSFFLIILIVLLYGILGRSTASVGNYINRFLWLISIWMAVYLWNYRSPKERKVVFAILSLVLFQNLIYTVIFKINFPEFNSAVQTYDTNQDLYGKVNIGGASTTASCMIYILALLCYYILYKSFFSLKKNFIYLFLIFALIFYVIFWGDTTTITITLLIGIVFLLFNKRRKSFAPVIVGIIFFILFLSNLDYVAWFAREFVNDRLADRLLAIGHLTSGNTSSDEDFLFSRVPMIGYDLHYWCDNIVSFVFGNGYHSYPADDMMSDLAMNKAGGHSPFFDTISRYGLVGIVLLISLISNFYKWMLKSISNRQYAIIIFILLLFDNIIYGIISSNVLFIIFFMLPILGKQNDASENKKLLVV